jgi:hypothetical protein
MNPRRGVVAAPTACTLVAIENPLASDPRTLALSGASGIDENSAACGDGRGVAEASAAGIRQLWPIFAGNRNDPPHALSGPAAKSAILTHAPAKLARPSEVSTKVDEYAMRTLPRDGTA